MNVSREKSQQTIANYNITNFFAKNNCNKQLFVLLQKKVHVQEVQLNENSKRSN
jgi:hypothetical protein